ncbi:hypothetical protein MUN84_18675 [Hymenobacter sp. 5516J-16]|uniref:hypothetical protein n=1 Tax=Hymenobacter sp. 5516J-16 TaxID=2932253 RepID=UPI001FD221E2|nr:hypothetical protein [Hymenobacter sp. 5516J-16]UOQ76539.1 hypothetical protein MUN84_18675 [Hymenobacter sp. 5516J-16]
MVLSSTPTESDTLYGQLQHELLTPLRRTWQPEALPLTEFEWLNAALLVRQRQRGSQQGQRPGRCLWPCPPTPTT